MSANTTTASQPTAPLTAMTTWERHEAGFPARDGGERARYAELDRCAAPRALPIPACPRDGQPLSGGPVVWHCPDGPHGHGVQAADLEREAGQ
jgi:hypothetical protein